MKTYTFSNIWEVTVQMGNGWQYSYQFVGTEEEVAYHVLDQYYVAGSEAFRADYKLAELEEDLSLCDVED